MLKVLVGSATLLTSTIAIASEPLELPCNWRPIEEGQYGDMTDVAAFGQLVGAPLMVVVYTTPDERADTGHTFIISLVDPKADRRCLLLAGGRWVANEYLAPTGRMPSK